MDDAQHRIDGIRIRSLLHLSLALGGIPGGAKVAARNFPLTILESDIGIRIPNRSIGAGDLHVQGELRRNSRPDVIAETPPQDELKIGIGRLNLDGETPNFNHNFMFGRSLGERYG
jgi:hypothetical protein